jgi:hypothetical protein
MKHMGIITKPVTWTGDYKSKFKSISFSLKGVDGFFRYGKKELPEGVEAGATIKVKATKMDDGNFKVAAIKVVEAAKKKGSGGGGGGKGGGGGYKKDPEVQAQIVFQHSQEMAIRYIEVLKDADALKAYKTSDTRRVKLDGLLDELIVKFYNDVLKRPQLSEAEEVKEDLEPSDDDLKDEFEDDDEDFDGDADEDDEDFEEEDDVDWDD